MFFPRKREGRLKDKAIDVVMALKVGLLLQLLLLTKIRHYVGHLDVGKSGVQVFRIHLEKTYSKQHCHPCDSDQIVGQRKEV